MMSPVLTREIFPYGEPSAPLRQFYTHLHYDRLARRLSAPQPGLPWFTLMERTEIHGGNEYRKAQKARSSCNTKETLCTNCEQESDEGLVVQRKP